MDIPATLDTAKYRQLVLQGIASLSGGTTSTNTAVGPDGVTRVPLQVNADGELKVNVEASINADLTLIENKLDTIIGIETPQASDVAAIKTELNNGIGVTGTFWQATQPVSGTVTANTGLTQPLTDTQLRATAVPVSGTVAVSGTVPVSIATAPTTPVTGTFWQATQPVSGTVTANTGLSQPLTDAQLRATAVPVSGTFYQATQPVSLASLPSLATGANTIGSISNTAFTANAGTNLNTSLLALESGGNLATIATNTGKIPSKGAATTANSTPVNIASDQTVPVSGTVTANTGLSQPLTDTQLRATAVPVSGTFYQATQPVSGTISSNTKDGSGTSITSTTVSSKQGLDVNIIAGGGSSVVTNAGTFAVQNTAATPAGTNFIGSVNPDSTGSGSVTTTVPYVVTTTNSGTLAFQSDAAATGNVTIEASVDGTNYNATTYTALTSGNTSSSFNAATATIGQIDTCGFKNIRFRSNTIVGTVGITYNLSKNVSNVMLDNPLPAGSNVIGQVTANAGTNLNTSALALESGGNLATVATKMSDGTQTTKIVNGANTLAVDSVGAVTINNQALSSVLSFSQASGSIAFNQVLLGPVTCSQHRDVCVHVITNGAGCNTQSQISNDNTNWTTVAMSNALGTATAQASPAGTNAWLVPTCGALYWRLISANAVSGSFTVNAVLSQQVESRPLQAVSVTNSVAIGGGSITPSPQTTVGFALYHTLVTAATTNATNVKTSAGVVGMVNLTNNSATWAYFKVCNTAASPTVGTTTAVLNIGIPPNTTIDCSTAFAGIRLSTGISYYVSGGTSLTDNTALALAGTVLVNMTYL